MDSAYSLAWNAKQQAYIAVPEAARRRGKNATRNSIAAAIASLMTSTAAHALDPAALPTGGVVTAGQATIGTNGNVMTIQQGSSKAAIDWQSFNIGSNAQVNFAQPSADAIALNRVVGQDPSQIFGTLRANGQVFIVNPNGVLFAPGAQVSAAGVLASTRGMGDEDFMAGKVTLSGSGAGTVSNEGTITAASGGYVVLIGAQVRNIGAITAPLGDVRLAAANQVSLQIAGAGLTALAVDQGTLDALAENHGLIKADGGRVFLTADALNQLAKATVNNTGVIEAQTVENHQGTIVLMGDMQQGSVLAGGTMDASAPNGGDGGFIETSAAHVQVAPTLQVSTRAAAGITGTWLIDPVDFTIAASGGDISGSTLSTNLGSSNVTIQSSTGTQGTAGDVNVNDVVSWSANKLTLNAQNNININANLNGSGTASLALEYGQGAVASGNTSKYILGSNVTIALPSGNNFSTKLGSDGTAKNFYVITSLGAEGSSTTTDLQGMRGGLSGNYALGADIDASATSTWQSGQGFTFIGTQGNVYSGNFEGLGHTIDGLFENWSVGYVGLFGKIDTTARVANVHLTNINIKGGLDNVGGLVGYASKGSVIEHVTVQGTVTGGNNAVGGVIGTNDGTVTDAHANSVSVTGKNYGTGGLIGKQTANGTTTLSDSSGTIKGFYDVGGLIGSSVTALVGLHSSATVTPTGGESGGLVGLASSKISDSYATGSVSSVNGDMIGGLVGQANGAISNSYATGDTTGGGGYTGGLAGKSNAAISNSYATGKVSGAHLVGGLAGFQKYGTTVSNSYATGAVSGTLYSIGGLIGSMGGSVSDSYATGNVTSKTDAVGGLIGSWSSGDNPVVKNSYATGTVNGRYAVGGLIGDTGGCACSVTDTHATGKITSSADYVGGLIGYVDLASIANSWSSSDVSGVNNVGGLAGQGVDISNSYATGKISGSTGVGGLVGLEKMGGTVGGGSYATGNVTGTVEEAGGLVGRNEGTVNGSSYATSLVVGVKSVGGLIGGNYGTVSKVQTGDGKTAGPLVSGKTNTGGLIGYNNAGVSDVLATGDVSGTADYTGGLIGFNDKTGVVTGSSASGKVSGVNNVGGLIGENDGSLGSSHFDTATVNGTGMVGGLVGYNTGTVNGASYTKQDVVGTGNAVGGLVGKNSGTVNGKVYANGAVTGVDQVGGLIGLNSGGSVTDVTAAVGAVTGHDQTGGLIGSLTGGTVSTASAAGAVTGNDKVGGWVGSQTAGTVSTASATGAVTGQNQVGGFAGNVDKGSSILSSTASGAVSGASVVGGFVGQNGTGLNGNLAPSNANVTTSTVTATVGQVGGFAGTNSGTLSNVNPTINLSLAGAVSDVGGIVGLNTGTLQNSYATSTVSASKASNVGGAVGRNDSSGSVTKTYATNSVTGLDSTGGLIGYNNASVSIAYASGSASGQSNVGGLIGKQASSGSATNVYATATASGSDHVGGLIGYGGGTVSYSYATGAVSASGSHVGGLLGSTNSANVSDSVFSLTGTGVTHSTGDWGVAEVASGKTATEMKAAATYASWNLSTTGSHDKVWRSYDGQAAPLLVNWLTLLTVSGSGGTASYVYDGTAHSATLSGLTYSDTPDLSLLLGGNSLSATNVGVYTGGSIYSVQQGYDITSSATMTLTITAAPLTATIATQSRAYDGTTTASLAAGQVTLTGFVGTDSASTKALTGTYNSKDVATTSSVSFSLSVSDLNLGIGTLASNYSLPATVTGTGTITPLSINGTLTALAKRYDGTTLMGISPGDITLSGFIGSDGATVTAEGNFNSKNVTEANSVTATITGATATGATNLGNYQLPTSITGVGSITPRPVTATIVNADRVYDGTDRASSQLNVTGLVQGEQLVLTGTGQFSDKNAGTGKTVRITNITGDSVAASNYTIASDIITTTATITPLALTVTAAGSDRAYNGGVADTVTLSAAGVLSGDRISFTGTGAFSDKNVGTGKIVTVSGISASGVDAANYSYNTSATTSASITPLALTLAASATDKVYDGTTAAQVQLRYSGVVTGDQISVSGSGSFADKNAGTGKTVTVKDIALGGKDSGNYSVAAGTVTTTATISPLDITVTARSSDKVYDGTVGANVVLQTVGVLTNDQLSLSGTGAFSDKNVGTAKTVTVTAISASGADAGNYRISNANPTTTASITPRPLTLTATGTTREYDGGVTDTVSVNASGVVAGDDFRISGDGSFADKNAGSDKIVTVTGIRATGADIANYSFSTSALTTSATITAKLLALNASASDRVYDGTTAAQVQLGYSGVVTGDQISVSGTGSFTDKNAGTGKTVTVKDIVLSGKDSANYSVAAGTVATTATVSARDITVTARSSDKVYDGTTGASVVLQTVGVLANDQLSLSGAGAFSDKNVGTAKTVTVTAISASGADAGNYRISNANPTTTASITPRPLTLTATGTNRAYDGGVTDIVSVNASGVVTGDDFRISGTGAFADKNAGTDKIVTVTGITASGADIANYSFSTSPLTTSATITPKLVALNVTATDKVYDGKVDDQVSLSASGVVAGDQVTFTGTGKFDDKNAGTAKRVTVSGISNSGADAGNYRANGQPVIGSASITPLALTALATGTDKVYDGKLNGAVTLTLNGVLAGDVVRAAANASFADKNVGTAKPLTLSGLVTSGADAANYSVTAGPATASITPRALTVTATGADRVYDGSVAAAVTLNAAGVLSGDSITFTGTSTFGDRNVGTGKIVTVSGISASGADATNYSYNSSAATQASISARQLSVTLAGTVRKVVDGNVDATLLTTNYVVGNVVSGEAITVNHAAGQYQDALTGSGKLVSTTLAAADYAAGANTSLSNYILVTGGLTGTVGVIVPANAAGSLNATVNTAGVSGEQGNVSLPLAYNAAASSIPTSASVVSVSVPNSTVQVSGGGTVTDSPLAPAPATAVSSFTSDSLSFRRAFSVSDGGIRLPQGVSGSQGDASQ